jgi:hypothetical protein
VDGRVLISDFLESIMILEALNQLLLVDLVTLLLIKKLFKSSLKLVERHSG